MGGVRVGAPKKQELEGTGANCATIREGPSRWEELMAERVLSRPEPGILEEPTVRGQSSWKGEGWV